MCGITGVLAFNEKGKEAFAYCENATQTLIQRGPDVQNTITLEKACFGHARLSIIDTSEKGKQPFTDSSGRYTIVFNGEIFNYKQLRSQLESSGIQFYSHSDTEVLLYLLINEGALALNKLNGFFAFAFYDKQTNSTLIARDRFGIKPLLYALDEDKLIFGSEMKAIMAYPVKREIDHTALHTYFQLNYIPGNISIFKSVKKLPPGHLMKIKNGKASIESYYKLTLAYKENKPILSYDEAQKKIVELMTQSVGDRMIADVPVGTFLSGGIDSSIITALAAQQTKNLKTFSIGYTSEPMFDETYYAELVAKKYQLDHTIFKISNDDLLHHLDHLLNYMDEPFADSSALAVSMLTQKTKQHITVALSGDGADEVFSGYNKHSAEYLVRNPGVKGSLLRSAAPFAKYLPKSRNSPLTNLSRKIDRYASGAKLTVKDRYWLWASIQNEQYVSRLLKPVLDNSDYHQLKAELLSELKDGDFLNDVLFTDVKMVLTGDMLKKVDLMSMSNSLEVRVPFLDHRVVEFAFSLPDHYKINSQMNKRLLKDAFRSYLPEELYTRPKHGFEVPLLKWFRNELADLIENDLLSREFIETQKIFNYSSIKELKEKLKTNNPGDSTATIWAIIIFNHWWKSYMQ